MILALLCTLLYHVSAGTFVPAKSQNRTLVVVDTWATLETHSIFFDHIRQMGAGNHTLEFRLISGSAQESQVIQQFNKYLYDNIILMAPTVKSFGLDMKIKDLLQFVDFHHNLMVFANDQSRKVVRDLVNEFGMDFEDYGYVMQGGLAPEGTDMKGENVAWSKGMFSPLSEDH